MNDPPLLPAIAVWMLFVLFLPVGTAQTGAGARQEITPSGIQVRLTSPQKPVTIGDAIQLELDISTPAGYQADLPQIGKQIGDFTILEFSPGPTVADSNPPSGVRHRRAILVVSAYKTGTLTFPPLQVPIRTPEGSQIVASSSPTPIQIQSVLSAKDRNLKDLKKQVEMREPFPWRFWLISLLALVVIGILILCFVKRRKITAPSAPRPSPLDPLDAAEAELKALLEGGLPEKGMVKHFYVRLSEIVRTILEAAYKISAVEQTTLEILESLERSGGGTADDRHRIASLLHRCDFVKFAKYIPSKPEHEAAAKDALQILEDSRKTVAQSQSHITGRPGIVESPLPTAH